MTTSPPDSIHNIHIMCNNKNNKNNEQEIIEAAKLRLATAKIQESSALKIVRSQRTMMEMMRRNMAIATSQLGKSRAMVRDAQMGLRKAECKLGTIRMKAKAPPTMSALSLNDDEPYRSPVADRDETNSNERNSNNTIALDSRRAANAITESTRQSNVPHSVSLSMTRSSLPIANQVKRRPSLPLSSHAPKKISTRLPTRSSQSQSTPKKQEPPIKLQSHLYQNLTPAAKVMLREIVLSAILHPEGEVDPQIMRQLDGNPMSNKLGLSKRAVLNAVAVARRRDGRKREGLLRCRLMNAGR